MRMWLARLLCATVVAAGVTLTSGVPARASSPIWDVTTVTSAPQAIVRNNGMRDITVICPTGRTAINGWVNPPAEGDDLRLIMEDVRTGPSEGSYFVRVQDQSGAAGTISITATARCVMTGVFSGPFLSVSNANNRFPVDDSTHQAEGTLSCPNGWSAVSAAEVKFANSAGSTLLTSTPTASLQSWHVAGWHDDVTESLLLRINCVPAADLGPLRFTSTTTSVSQWGTPASASCSSGLIPIIGGTWDVSANPDAISVYSRPTSNGWSSTTLTLDTASIFTALFCLPAANPTAFLDPTAGVTSSSTATWTFSGSDPAASGGYTLSFECTFAHNGVVGSPGPCTSPLQRTNLPDGLHALTLVARTSDGRQSLPHARNLYVDTTDPTVAFQEQAGHAFNTASPAIVFTASDSGTGLTLVECRLDAVAPVPCAENSSAGGSHRQQLSDVSPGAHTMHVRVVDGAGNEATYDLPFTVDTAAPTVDFQTPAGSAFKTVSPGIAFTSADSGTGVSLNECWLDDAPPAPCTTEPNTGGARTEQLSDVSEGLHTMHVRVTDGAGNQATGDLAFKVDTIAPTTTMTKPSPPITASRSVTVAWSVTDAISGLNNTSVRSRRSPFDAGFTAFSTPITAPAATTSRVYDPLVLGSTYCWSARSTDKAGNTAAVWSAERCTAIPLDDRQLTRSAGWTASTPTGWFQSSGLTTSTRGATLSMSGVVLKRAGIVAVTCPTCGVVAITVNGTEVGRVNLEASTTSRKLKALHEFSLRSGKVAIKVLSSGKPVRIDALAVSRK